MSTPFAFLRYVPQILVIFVMLSDKKPLRNFWYVTLMPTVLADALLRALLKLVVTFCIYESVTLEWQLSFASIRFRFLGS